MLFTENQLSLCKSNDPKSQRKLYDFFKPKVMGLCRRYTKTIEEAEDVFQETFIRVFRSIRQVKDVGHLHMWVNKIAVNTAINYYHKNKRHDHVDEHNGYHYQSEEYELILSQFSDEVLIDLINHLPDGYRLVFNLYVMEGYSHAEIAELLHIEEASSRSQLNRAKQTLKNKLSALGIIKYEKYS
jgi:RNA polymerase sigma factor (sigma-70 family)